MEKNNNSVSPIEGICAAIAALLFFLCGCFMGIGLTVWLIILSAMITFFIITLYDKQDFTTPSGFLCVCDAIFSLWIFLLICVLTNSYLWGISAAALYAVIAVFLQKEKKIQVIFRVCLGVVCGFIFDVVGGYVDRSRYRYYADKQLYARCIEEQNILKETFDSADMAKFSNPYLFYQTADSAVQAGKVKCYNILVKTDSLKKELAKEKTTETLVIDFPKLLRIKRIWQNSDVQPWSYWGYTYVYLQRFGGSSGVRTRFGNVIGRYPPKVLRKMSGSAREIGENRLDYINVVLSDNSFYQLKVKDSYEWLVAGEGDLVEVDGNKLVPLFKK